MLIYLTKEPDCSACYSLVFISLMLFKGVFTEGKSFGLDQIADYFFLCGL